MVDAGLAVTVAPVVGDNPVAGDQLYVVAPLAVNNTLAPLQREAEAGVTVIVGIEFMITDVVAVCAAQPPAAAIVYVTV